MKYSTKNMVALTTDMCELACLNGPLNTHFDPGHKDIVVVTGENATGKSFIRRLYYTILKQMKLEVIHLSQQGRSSSGIPAAMIYGDESYNSTGYLTALTVVNGIKNCQKREHEHYIIWDEPDIGLSEKYSGAVGVKIREFVENIPALTKGVVVISHSKPLIRQLLPLNPSHLRVGGCSDLKTWLNTVDEPGNLEDLFARNEKVYDEIAALIKASNK
ncbi:MAG: hypothetical protein PHF86_14970 [Candidatus Nanoarchaeia archaeon]|nr:hypothetical protein [Candidatus Nanoarchaeia archaeon]